MNSIYIPRHLSGARVFNPAFARGPLRGLGRLGDACSIAASLTPSFTNDQIASAFNALVQTFHDEQNDYTSMVQWLNQNGQSLSPDGQQEAIAALQLKTSAVNDLQDIVSQAQAIVSCLGITGVNTIPTLSGAGGRHLGRLGLWPAIAVGVVVAVLTAMGLWALIQAANAKADQAKAQFADAQAKQQIVNTASQQLAAGNLTPDQYLAILEQSQQMSPCPDGYTRNAQGGCDPSVLSNIPWKTVGFVALGIVAVRSLFG